MAVKKYRKKPVVIEAMQLQDNATEVLGWMQDNGVVGSYQLDDGGPIFISTLEGTMQANQGDFIIRGVEGEFYPCKPDIFTATYEPEDTSIEAQTYKDSYTGNTFNVGSTVRYRYSWGTRRGGMVKRIFKKSAKSRWYIEIEGVDGPQFASDYERA